MQTNPTESKVDKQMYSIFSVVVTFAATVAFVKWLQSAYVKAAIDFL